MADLRIVSLSPYGYGLHSLAGLPAFYVGNGLVYSMLERMKIRTQFGMDPYREPLLQSHFIIFARQFLTYASKIVTTIFVDQNFRNYPECLVGCAGAIVGKILTHPFDTVYIHRILDPMGEKMMNGFCSGLTIAIVHSALLQTIKRSLTIKLEEYLVRMSATWSGSPLGARLCETAALSIALILLNPLEILKNQCQKRYCSTSVILDDTMVMMKHECNKGGLTQYIAGFWNGWYWQVPIACSSIFLTHLLFRGFASVLRTA